jgi:hypothetical protein
MCVVCTFIVTRPTKKHGEFSLLITFLVSKKAFDKLSGTLTSND